MEDYEPVCQPFDQPVACCILVVGPLDCAWSEYLGGLQIVCRHGKGGITLCRLVGNLPDQASLFGVLNTLYDLGLTLLVVRSRILPVARREGQTSKERKNQ